MCRGDDNSESAGRPAGLLFVRQIVDVIMPEWATEMSCVPIGHSNGRNETAIENRVRRLPFEMELRCCTTNQTVIFRSILSPICRPAVLFHNTAWQKFAQVRFGGEWYIVTINRRRIKVGED